MTKEEAIAELKKEIEEHAIEIRKCHSMMSTSITPHSEITTIEATMLDILPR
jgi:hypothetical protein